MAIATASTEDTQSHSRWRLNAFGGPILTRGDVTIKHFRTQKTASLLVYLGNRIGNWHTRDVLANVFWPGDSPDSARLSLRVAISCLRRALNDHRSNVLQVDRNSVRLDPEEIESDVDEL